MSRLIDADVLWERLDKRRTYEIMDGRNKAYGKGVRDAMKDLEDTPTIDAITVEWLEAQIRPYTGDVSDIGKSARNGTIKNLIRKWQKEQEAR